MSKMAPQPPGPAPATRASGVQCGDPDLARAVVVPRLTRPRMEKAGAGRAKLKRARSRQNSSSHRSFINHAHLHQVQVEDVAFE
ncbi:hypothetical protein NDU88_006122 [Pleurodeles waltl]|uniref:Uncharacterized protein n=1 Tax=Pleurodeles waltl TaxID=8319 RepID=A0AAV7WD14_PLEWA|nr:hypothetical protein NDU88_006122 [Pleurodeles waltl]